MAPALDAPMAIPFAGVCPGRRASEPVRSLKMKTRLLSGLALRLVFVGCGTLPSSYDVESKFKAQNAGCAIQSVAYTIEGERKSLVPGPGELVRDEAVFQVTYRMPGDSTNRVAFRRFRRGPEGWVEQVP
jgi:hypothetical protein